MGAEGPKRRVIVTTDEQASIRGTSFQHFEFPKLQNILTQDPPQCFVFVVGMDCGIPGGGEYNIPPSWVTSLRAVSDGAALVMIGPWLRSGFLYRTLLRQSYSHSGGQLMGWDQLHGLGRLPGSSAPTGPTAEQRTTHSRGHHESQAQLQEGGLQRARKQAIGDSRRPVETLSGPVARFAHHITHPIGRSAPTVPTAENRTKRQLGETHRRGRRETPAQPQDGGLQRERRRAIGESRELVETLSDPVACLVRYVPRPSGQEAKKC